ncbi:Nitrilotriacetate monooxygenase component A [Candidatus Paraburkholderia calva]|nr:Nitrilotriacetate monooxygenase component A [Candidatus Paraburkholderia calva]
MTMIREQKLTLRQLYTSYGRGKVTLCGTPQIIADHMEEWIDTRAADGFMLAFHVLPNEMTDFIGQIVPELQRHGNYRKEYSGHTMRDNLGLSRPVNRHVRNER